MALNSIILALFVSSTFALNLPSLDSTSDPAIPVNLEYLLKNLKWKQYTMSLIKPESKTSVLTVTSSSTIYTCTKVLFDGISFSGVQIFAAQDCGFSDICNSIGNPFDGSPILLHWQVGNNNQDASYNMTKVIGVCVPQQCCFWMKDGGKAFGVNSVQQLPLLNETSSPALPVNHTDLLTEMEIDAGVVNDVNLNDLNSVLSITTDSKTYICSNVILGGASFPGVQIFVSKQCEILNDCDVLRNKFYNTYVALDWQVEGISNDGSFDQEMTETVTGVCVPDKCCLWMQIGRIPFGVNSFDTKI